MRRTILTTPSYGDKVLAHMTDESLELSEVFAHADPKIKPQIKVRPAIFLLFLILFIFIYCFLLRLFVCTFFLNFLCSLDCK